MAKRIVGLHFDEIVRKSDASGDAIEVGDTLGLRLNQAIEPGDGDVYDDVTVTHVQDGGRSVFWDAIAEAIEVDHVAAIDSDHNPVACP